MRFRIQTILLTMLLLGFSQVFISAQDAIKTEIVEPSLSDMLPVDEQVTIGTLDNGLTYYIKENRYPANRAVLRLVINAGSILEEEHQRGVAHFVEHMAFNGTASFGKEDLVDYFERIGMRFGPEVNAHTGFDETVYKLEIPTEDPRIVEKSFHVLQEWASTVTFDPAEIERERGVIIEEWRLGRGAEARMQEEYFPVLFKGSRYAQRLPIGKKSVIETCDRTTLMSFYDDWYRPDLMAVVAVGDFDAHEIEKTISTYFGALEAKENPKLREEYPVPGHTETLYAVATDPEATNTVLKLIYKHAAREIATIADYRKSIVRHIYNRMLNARLDERVHKQDPPFIFGYSSFANVVRTGALYQLACIVREEGVEEGLAALVREAIRAKRFGFTPGELDRVKRELLSSYEHAFRERESTESSVYAQQYADHFLEGEAVPGIEYEYELNKRYLPEITLNEVNQVAFDLITDRNRVVIVTGPKQKTVELPGEERLATVLSEVGRETIEAYKDDATDDPLMPDEPISGTIVSETYFPEIDTHQWRLSNGITVVAKPTTFKNDQVVFSAFSPGGLSVVADANYWSAYLAPSIIMTSGVADVSSVQLDKILAGKQVSVSPYISDITEGFFGRASPEDLDTLFQLIYLYATSPRKDTVAYEAFMQRMRAYIKNRTARPESQFQDEIQKTIYQNHYRRSPLSVEILDTVVLDEAHRVYSDRFADAGDFTFFFAGAFSPQVLKELSTTYLAALPAIERDETWQDRNIDFPEEKISKTVRKGVEPKSYVAILFGRDDYSWDMQKEYHLDSLVEVLDINLRKIVTEQAGGSYNVQVNYFFDKYPDNEYHINIVFGCDPKRTEELSSLVLEELESLRSTPPTEEVLEKVKEIQKRTYEVSLEKNEFWVNQLYQHYLYKTDPRVINTYPEMVNGLTGEDIQRTAEAVLPDGTYVRVILLPETSD